LILNGLLAQFTQNLLENVVKISNISFSYNPFRGKEILILNNIDICLTQKAITVLLGPSGCGKTTLLNLIAGLIKPTSGSINFSLEGNKPAKFGYVFQSPSLIPWKTVRENILLGAKVNGGINKEIEDRANNLLVNYGLFDFADKYPVKLSGGMQQRVSIIRAVLSGANILLLDEPHSNSDYKVRKELQEDLSDLVDRENLIAILVTHDILEAVRLADQIVIFSNRPTVVADIFNIPLSRNERLLSSKLISESTFEYTERINKVLTQF
jgi:NitT/TauT family transport system ATP-binding protein